MQLIQTVTVGAGGAASIDFNSIPQTFTDLVVMFSLRNASNAVDAEFTFNTLATNRSSRRLYGAGSGSGSSDTTTNLSYLIVPSSATANTFGNGTLYIPNYTSANVKSVSVDAVTEFNATAAYQLISAGLWNATAAISSIQIRSGAGQSLVEYSSASLYGILAGSSGGVTVS